MNNPIKENWCGCYEEFNDLSRFWGRGYLDAVGYQSEMVDCINRSRHNHKQLNEYRANPCLIAIFTRIHGHLTRIRNPMSIFSGRKTEAGQRNSGLREVMLMLLPEITEKVSHQTRTEQVIVMPHSEGAVQSAFYEALTFTKAAPVWGLSDNTITPGKVPLGCLEPLLTDGDYLYECFRLLLNMPKFDILPRWRSLVFNKGTRSRSINGGLLVPWNLGNALKFDMLQGDKTLRTVQRCFIEDTNADFNEFLEYVINDNVDHLASLMKERR